MKHETWETFFLKKHTQTWWRNPYTHVKIPRWGTPQKFLLAFIDELWKTQKIRILKKWRKKKIAEVWRYRVRQILFVILGHFLPFTPKRLPPLKPENQNLEKMKNTSGDAIILNCATKNMIKWCVLTQMWSAISF